VSSGSPRWVARTAAARATTVLCGVLVSTLLAMTVGPQVASASPGRSPQGRGVQVSATFHRVARCRRRHAGDHHHAKCAAPRAVIASFFVDRNISVAITSGPAAGATSSSSAARFTFASNAAAARFDCSLDSGAFSSCTSPISYPGLSAGSHSFRVFALEFGFSSAVASVSWKIAAANPTPRGSTPPSVPTGLSATPGDGQVALTWSRRSSDNVAVAGYWVLRDGSAIAQVTGTSYTDHGVSDGTTYSYSVEAYDAAGNISAPSATVSATPTAPTPAPLTVTGGSPPSTPASGGDPPAPLTSWVPATGGFYTPLSDAQAAADVTPEPENRSANVPENDYVPTSAQLQAFYSARNNNGQTVVQANPYDQYVTGDYTGTTDEIIQWAAWKWGIPADWLRAEYLLESNWNQSALGDETTVSPAVYAEYPPQARIPNSDNVYESMGISQIKWAPDGSQGAGTEQLRWESTAFNADYQAATLRFYYDNPDGLRSAWGDSTYSAGNAWDSLGGWFEPYPWLNSGQLSYIASVQSILAARTWAQPGF
jgi:hypothetical protein